MLRALWLLARHPATPRPARWLALAVLAYAVSPIDLIPDFIPVLGYLDDALLIPLGVMWVVRLVPKPLWQACMRDAERLQQALPKWVWGTAAVLLLWLLTLGLGGWWLLDAAG